MLNLRYTHCPECQSELEVRDVAPCAECGHVEHEIEHALTGRHTFAEMRIFGDLSVVLCSFCQVDFGSFDPVFFGLPCDAEIGFEKMQFVRDAPVLIGKDKCCPRCNLRLTFLKFVIAARELHGEQEQARRDVAGET